MVAEGEQPGDEERDATDVRGEGDGVGCRHAVDDLGVTEAEGQQGESERELAEDRGGASRGDVIVHGGLPSCMCGCAVTDICPSQAHKHIYARVDLSGFLPGAKRELTVPTAHLTWDNNELRNGNDRVRPALGESLRE